MSETADRHALYEHAVQCAEAEIDFVDKTYRQLKGKRASILREDFCGTANVCCEWVRRGSKRTAFGVDLDPEVLDWGKRHQLSQLKSKQRERIKLIRDNVLTAKTGNVDIVSEEGQGATVVCRFPARPGIAEAAE